MQTLIAPQTQEQAITQEAAPTTQRFIFWIALGLIAVAEFLTFLVQAQIGLGLHVLVLLGLLVYAGVGRRDDERKLAFALILAPLIRLLSLSLPLTQLPQMAWYPVVSIPLLIATWLIIRQTNTSAQAVHFRPGCIWLQCLLALGGFGLGALEYVILRPALPSLSWDNVTLLWTSISFIVFTGFTEEIIFRGLLQTRAMPVLGRFSIVYMSLLFAALHIGYLSIIDIVFVCSVGIIFGYIVQWGRSLLGVSLAHGLTNITLFIIMPSLMTQIPESLSFITTMSVIGGIAFLISIGGLLYQARQTAKNLSDTAPVSVPSK